VKGGTMRRGGLAIVVIVLLGALGRIWTPQTPPAVPSPQVPSVSASTTNGEANIGPGGPKAPSGSFGIKIQEKIRTFFGEPLIAGGTACADVAHYCVPPGSTTDIRFVIATVPDPVHSHLAHFFDASIEAIEQGAFNEGYLFDRAIMPWAYAAPSSSTPAAIAITNNGTNVVSFSEGKASTVRIDRTAKPVSPESVPKSDEIPPDSFPGLMIFRESEIRLNARRDKFVEADLRSKPLAGPLFVFVVGETPTAGINKDQFRYAVQIIHQIRKGKDVLDSADEPDFGVIGPTFSGSLYSMRAVLQQYTYAYADGYRTHPNRFVPVYGTVLGTSTIKWFQETMPDHVRMVLFQQDSATMLNALYEFVNGMSYGNGTVAILSEDETAYGGGKLRAPTTDSQPLYLFFPRGISLFRSEYTKQISGTANSAQGGNQPTNLRLDLAMTGSDDDSVAPYAKAQAPVTQESVMLGIVSELRQHESKFVVLRSTDPLDEVFLAHYLHDKYPQGRIVVPTPDLLLAREGDAPLDGVLGLNTYPLTPTLPDSINPLCAGLSEGETFAAARNIAAYNATTALIRRLGELHRDAMDILLSNLGPGAMAPATGPMDQSACSLSPNLWLTMVSRNAIRPIKVLGVEDPSKGSPLFPKGTDKSHQRDQRDARVPLWVFAYIGCLAAMFRHAWLSWTGGDFGLWMTPGQFAPWVTAKQFEPSGKRPRLQRKACLLCFGGLVLAAIFIVLISVWFPVDLVGNEWWVWVPLFVFVAFTGHDFWQRRSEPQLAVLFAVAVATLAWAALRFGAQEVAAMVLWQQRTIDLASGASVATPVLFLLIAVGCWFWYSFRAEGLVEWRRPKLPARKELPQELYSLTDEMAEKVCGTLNRFTPPWWIPLAAVIAVLCFAVPSAVVTPGHAPIRSLEGLPFDRAYSLLLGVVIVLLLATLLRLVAVWRSFFGILRSMDRDGMRDALRRLSGFEWSVIWNPAWSVENEGHKMVFREIQVLERLQESLGKADSVEPTALRELRLSIQSAMNIRADLIRAAENPLDKSQAGIARQMKPHYESLLRSFAAIAGSLCTSYLLSYWKRPAADEHKDESDHSAGEASRTSINLGIGQATVSIEAAAKPSADPSGLPPASLRVAEDFVATVYASFLVTVLLAVRGLVITAVVVYACIVLSTVSYPFEPAPDLAALSAVLFAFSGYVIWYIYEEMHRDATLSLVTSTVPGKLDQAFWAKFVAAGIVPLIALITTLYPPFGHLLYTLVGPLLQALR
jgi:hypothetical protein